MNADDIISLFQTMYREHWSYGWGAAEKGCVDCSGAFVYAYRQYGLSCPHGSNAIARKEITGGMLPPSAAVPGMAAFKAKTPGQSGYNLPCKYKEGYPDYNGDLNDYYHIGLIDSDPRYVLNAKSTEAGFSRDPLFKWDWVAKLTDVNYSGGVPMEKGVVVLPAGATGSTVNMRRSPSKSADIVARVPVGAEVGIISDLGQWMEIEYGGKSGYMMSNYIEYADQDGEASIDAELKTITECAETILEMVEKIGAIVGRG